MSVERTTHSPEPREQRDLGIVLGIGVVAWVATIFVSTLTALDFIEPGLTLPVTAGACTLAVIYSVLSSRNYIRWHNAREHEAILSAMTNLCERQRDARWESYAAAVEDLANGRGLRIVPNGGERR